MSIDELITQLSFWRRLHGNVEVFARAGPRHAEGIQKTEAVRGHEDGKEVAHIVLHTRP